MKKLLSVVAILSLVFSPVTPAFAVSPSTWNVDADGNWSAAGSWDAGGVPNGQDWVANLTFDIGAARTASVDGAGTYTIGTLNIGDASHAYLLNSTGGTLTFDVAAGSAAINQAALSVSQTISVPLILSDALVVTNNSAVALNVLTISGTMTNGANLLTLAGASGDITVSGAITGSGGITTTGANDITVNSATNAVSGNFTLTANDATIVNTLTTNLAASTLAGNLSVTTNTAGADITDSGVIAVTGTSSFTASAANDDITLDSVSTYTGAVSLATNGATGNISLTNVGANLSLGTITTTLGGTLAIETDSGSITDNGVITASGTSSFAITTVGDDITLDQISTYAGAVSFTAAGAGSNVSLTNANAALNLGAATVGGTFTIETDNDGITDSGVLAITGASSFTTTEAAADIVLDQVSTYTGAVSLNTAAGAGNDATLINANAALNLGASTVGGIFTIDTDVGSITNSGVLTITGASSFTTTAANEDITLDQVNLFTGAVSLATNGLTGNISLTNAGQALSLGTITTTLGGTLAIETNSGSITDSGVITASGTSSFAVTTAGDDITLDQISVYTGAVSFTAAGAGSDVSLTNANAALNLGASTVGGNFAVETDNDGITDSGVLAITGTSSFTTTEAGADIALDQISTYTGAVSLNTAAGAGNDASLINANDDINLGASTVGGTFTIETDNDNITDSGVLTITGASSFTTTEANADITLDEISTYTGAVSMATNGATGNISLTNAGAALNLGTITTTLGGTLAIETNTGSITDSGVITASGTSSFTTSTANDDITLNSGLIASGAITLSTAGTSGDATIVNTVATTLAASTIGGALSVDSSDNSLTVSGAVSTAAAEGTLTLDAGTSTLTTNATLAAGTGKVTLTAATIDLNESVTAAGGEVELNATTLADLATTKSITTTDVGANSGIIDINVSGTGTVNLAGNLVTTGADNGAGAGYAGGAVTVDTADGVVAVNNITTSGGAGTGAAGGAAGSITLNTSADTITLNGNLTAVGGTGTTAGAGGTIDVSDAALLGAAVTVSSGTGNINFFSTIANGGNLLTINNTGASIATISGIVSGAGGLTKDGTGTLTLSGINEYDGITTINAGTVNVNQSFTPGAAFVFGGAGTVNLADGKNISGAITTTGVGVGTLNFLGSSTTGEAIGTVANPLDAVNIAGLVQSAFAIRAEDIDIANNGTLQLGANISTNTTGGLFEMAAAANAALDLQGYTLTHTGNMTFGEDSDLYLDLTTATSSFGNATVSGALTLPATVDITVNVIGSSYIASGATFLVIESGAGSTTVPTVTDNSYILSFTAATLAGDLTLTAIRSQALNTLPGENGNTKAVGTALEGARAGATGDMLDVLATLDGMSSSQEIISSLETMMPDVSSGALQGSRSLNSHFLTAIQNRLSYARNGFAASPDGFSAGDGVQGMGFWMQGLGSHANQGTRDGIQGYSANTFGTSIGFDKLLDKHFRIGASGGYGFGSINSKTAGSPHTNINSFQGAIYGSFDSVNLNQARKERKYSPEAVRNQSERLWYVDGMLSFTQNNYNSKRDISIGSEGRTAKADHYAQQYSTQLEGGYTFLFDQTRDLEVTPFASLGYNYLYMNKYKEKGADSLDLNVQGKGFNQFTQGLGMKFAYPILAEEGTYIPSVKGAWLFDYITDKFQTSASFAGGGPSFSTIGVSPSRNAFLVGAELAFLNRGNMTLTGNFDWMLREQYQSYTYYLTLRFDF